MLDTAQHKVAQDAEIGDWDGWGNDFTKATNAILQTVASARMLGNRFSAYFLAYSDFRTCMKPTSNVVY